AAAAGAGRAAVASSLEAMAAAAGGDGVRVVDREASAHQAVHVVDLAAGDVASAHLIDQQADALHLGDDIAFLRLIERHAILHAEPAAAGDEDAQTERGIAFRIEQLTHLLDGGGGHGYEGLLCLNRICHGQSSSLGLRRPAWEATYRARLADGRAGE